MAWIEVHQTLPTGKKLARFRRKLDISHPEAVGMLVMLWLWALDNAPDGSLDGMEPADIAEICGFEGDAPLLVEALKTTGFADDAAGSLILHDWHDYAGRLVERRKANAERMRRARSHTSPHDPSPNGTRSEHVQDTLDARAGATVPYRTVPKKEDDVSLAPAKAEPDDGDDEFKRTCVILREAGFELSASAKRSIGRSIAEFPRQDPLAVADDLAGYQQHLLAIQSGERQWNKGDKRRPPYTNGASAFRDKMERCAKTGHCLRAALIRPPLSVVPNDNESLLGGLTPPPAGSERHRESLYGYYERKNSERHA